MATRMEAYSDHMSNDTTFPEAPVSVLVRTRNDAPNFERIISEIVAQDFANEVQVVLVDTESTDGTTKITHPRLDIQVVPITQAEFTHPKALNRGMEAADAPVVYSIVGHGNLSNDQTLRAVSKQFTDPNVAGTYGVTFPGMVSSRTERFLAGPLIFSGLKPAEKIKKSGMGVLAANCAAFRRDVWQELGGFDPAYEAGGEDTELAKRMLAAGFDIVREPLLSVHHSHGLGPVDSLKQVWHWMSILRGPQEFNAEKLAARRPDLDIS